MSIEFHISELDLRTHAPTREFKRGQSYYQKGHVVQLHARNGMVEAQVAGTGALPYRIRVAFHNGAVAYGTCDCSYRRRGWCKHIVAAMIAFMQDGGKAGNKSASLEGVLDELDAQTLRVLLYHLAEQNPALVKTIKDHLSYMSVVPVQTQPSKMDTRPATGPVVDEADDFYNALGSSWDVETESDIRK